MKIFNFFRLVLALGLLIIIAWLTREICDRAVVQQVRKYDDANINHMKYGLFNVNTWKDKMTTIVVAEIEDFQVTNTNKKDLKKHVEGQLQTLIDKLDQQIKETNKNSTKGWLKQKLINAFVDVKDIKASVPNYADTIVQEMTDKDSQKKLKDVIRGRVAKYLDETFEPQDMSEVESIIQRANAKNRQEATDFLARIVPMENERLYSQAWLLIGLVVLLFLVSIFHFKHFPAPYFLICMMALSLMLYAGVTCPMIDMVARISNFSFVLFGHPVEFTNQIVYFQSKSILDVFWILMEDPDLQMKIVGVLMIVFSVVFPFIKMVFSIFYFYNLGKAQSRWWVRFFVLKSGKWSMTDVQIVAILMAYIGFNGMVTTQFNVMRQALPRFDLISTNDTTLQIGFYIFLCYVILAMVLSEVMERKMKKNLLKN